MLNDRKPDPAGQLCFVLGQQTLNACAVTFAFAYGGDTQKCQHCKLNKVSPVTERNLNILAPSPVKFSNCKQSEIKATINIITNPNADLFDEPIWQVNPMHFKNMKSELEKLKLTQKPEKIVRISRVSLLWDRIHFDHRK